jgi:hypothetical protein
MKELEKYLVERIDTFTRFIESYDCGNPLIYEMTMRRTELDLVLERIKK